MEQNQIIITIMSGAEDGRVFELEDTSITIGRHPEDTVYLSHDNRVSRHHARITQEGDKYYIEDVGVKGEGSANGTYIADNRIDTKTAISSGEIILLGSVLIKFVTKERI
jgi:pSer/pThr/pTyr-binding forkhead associated (FHA) protein